MEKDKIKLRIKELEATKEDVEACGYADNAQDAKFYRNTLNRLAREKAKLEGYEKCEAEKRKQVNELKQFIQDYCGQLNHKECICVEINEEADKIFKGKKKGDDLK